MALRLIDQLGLYNIIFTNADDDKFALADTSHWYRAYNQLHDIITAQSQQQGVDVTDLSTLKTILLRNPIEEHHAWLLCALVPWARASPPKLEKPGAKTPLSLAFLAVREGVKADNKVAKLVEEAVHSLEGIITQTNKGIVSVAPADLPQKRKFEMVDIESRVDHGKAIRLWGSSWRSSVIYALLVQISESEESSRSTHQRTWLD